MQLSCRHELLYCRNDFFPILWHVPCDVLGRVLHAGQPLSALNAAQCALRSCLSAVYHCMSVYCGGISMECVITVVSCCVVMVRV